MRVNLQIKDKKSSSLLFIYLCCVKEINGIFAHHYCPWRYFLMYQDYSSYFQENILSISLMYLNHTATQITKTTSGGLKVVVQEKTPAL